MGEQVRNHEYAEEGRLAHELKSFADSLQNGAFKNGARAVEATSAYCVELDPFTEERVTTYYDFTASRVKVPDSEEPTRQYAITVTEITELHETPPYVLRAAAQLTEEQKIAGKCEYWRSRMHIIHSNGGEPDITTSETAEIRFADERVTGAVDIRQPFCAAPNRLLRWPDAAYRAADNRALGKLGLSAIQLQNSYRDFYHASVESREEGDVAEIAEALQTLVSVNKAASTQTARKV